MKKNWLYFLVFLSLGIFIGIESSVKPSQNSKTNIAPTPAIMPATTSLTKTQETEMTFTFAGDAMFGRAVYNQFGNDLTKAFRNLDKSLFNSDINILNLEGPIVEEKFIPDTTPDNLVMKFPPSTKDALGWLNINAISLGNNHTLDQGNTALDFTKKTLANAKITSIGDQQNKNEIVKVFEKEDLKIAILAINFLTNTPDLEEEIKKQKNDNAFVIIFPHWGNEYQSTHNKTQEKLARNWIDEGADLIIGSHPHVVQDAEIYKEKPIFYSLGNFLFDQTFSKETQRSLVIKGKIKGNKLTLELIPLGSLHLRLYVLEDNEKEQIIKIFEKTFKNQINNSLIELNIN
ncbi:MAG: CapA family protein [Patescibacteria group bacterium]